MREKRTHAANRRAASLVGSVLVALLTAFVSVSGAAAAAGRGPATRRSPATSLRDAARQGPATSLHEAAREVRAVHYPVSVRSDGHTVTIERRPRRILCLSPSATQMLYTIGAWKEVAGVDKYSAWPPKAPRTTFTGGETNAADYLSVHPDLVILSFVSGEVVTQLETLHIPALVLPPATTIPGAERQIRELGVVTGHIAGASAEVTSLNRDLRRTVASAHGKARGKTYYVEITPTYYSATSKTFIGAIFSRFSMVDIADPAARAGSTYPQLSPEYLVKADPDFVFLADTVCCSIDAENFAARPGFSTLRAVHLDHVIGVNDSLASEWGPHSLEQFAAVIARAVRAPARLTTTGSGSLG